MNAPNSADLSASAKPSVLLTKRQFSLSLWVIFIGVLSTGMGQTVVFAILPSLGRDLGLKEFEVGLIITGSSIVYSTFSPIWGRASDRWGRKKIMLVGLFGYTAGTFLFATTFLAGYREILTGAYLVTALVVARMLQSLVMSATAPSATAYIADVTTPEQRTIGMGRMGAAHNLGTILGPAVGGGLVFISLLAPLYAAAAMTLMSAFLVWWLLPSVKTDVSTQKQTKRMSYFDRRYVAFMFIGVTMFTAFAVTQQTLGFYYQDSLELSVVDAASWVGVTMMVSAVTSLSAQAIFVQLLGWSPLTLMKVGAPLTALGFAHIVFGDSLIWYLTGMGFVGFGMGLIGPGFTAAATLAVGPNEQGGVAGLISACPALGYIVGPLLGTSLYQLNPLYPYIVTLVIVIPLSVFIWLLSSDKPISSRPE